MPQATLQQRGLMEKWFGDIDIFAPLKFLRSHGYTEDDGLICKPAPAHTVSWEEGKCIDFLFDEWDFAFDPFG